MKHSGIFWYSIHDIDLLDSPALVVYPDRVQENIHGLLQMVQGEAARLRPHVKTHKTIEAVQSMLAAGITKYKCATIAEAEMLGMCKAPDVLLAYQPTGPKAHRFAGVIRKFPNSSYACLIDNKTAASEMAELFSHHGIRLTIYIDLNVGQNRTGIAPGEQAMELYSYCCGLQALSVAGLHAYDGHIRKSGLADRKQACDDAFAKVQQMKNDLVAAGFAPPVIIAGGSPTFSIHAKRKDVECSPGTFVFWDKDYSDLCPEQPFVPAAVLVTRVVSLPDERHICLDLGHKSVAAEKAIGSRVYFPEAPDLKPVSQSEEHLVLDAGNGHPFKPGDVLYGIPYHICPTVALYERLHTVHNGRLTGEWKVVARDRKITI